MAEYDIELRAVSKRYGDTLAVDDFSLGIERGEFVTLLGPSGCGKTTTLNMIAGFITPTSGDIDIKGTPVTDLPPFERDTSMVFQSYALFPHMTVFDNVAFGLRMRKVEKSEIAAKVGEALHKVHLAGLESRYPRELSGGQQQRVALARAIVTRPAVLLLDEPLSNLDLKLREAMRLELKSLQRDLGITSVYVTHDQDEALAMSDRIAVMNLGHIEQVGSPEEVYESPATLFVATFVGATNLMPGVVQASDPNTISVKLDGADATLAVRRTRDFAPGDRVLVTVRPEKCTLQMNHDPAAANSVALSVNETMVTGADVKYMLAMKDGTPFTVTALNVDGSLRPSPGEQVSVHLPPHHCIAFPVDEVQAVQFDDADEHGARRVAANA